MAMCSPAGRSVGRGGVFCCCSVPLLSLPPSLFTCFVVVVLFFPGRISLIVTAYLSSIATDNRPVGTADQTSGE
jgi:hypothetical protein